MSKYEPFSKEVKSIFGVHSTTSHPRTFTKYSDIVTVPLPFVKLLSLIAYVSLAIGTSFIVHVWFVLLV